MIILIPIYPIFLIMKETMLEYASKDYEISINDLEEAKCHVYQFIQGDFGLESHLQIVISIILLLLARSETRTIIGLEVLFEDETWFYLPTDLALGLSIAWSLYSCIRSHLKGIGKKRVHSTTLSFMVMLVYTTTSVALRVFCYILFLSPCLGLMDLLRHLQGEMYPFYIPYTFISTHMNTTDLFHFGDAPPIPWNQISRWDYIEPYDAQPPDHTLYTVFTIEQYFWMLLGIMALNIFAQFMVKRFANPQSFQKLIWIDCLIHIISCCFIPHPMEDWDEEKGTKAKHIYRKHQVFREMFASITVNFSFNLLLLSPLIPFGVNVFERHELLVNTIGAFPEEYQSFEQIKLMIALSFSLLVTLTFVQVVTYYLFNGRLHPFNKIITSEKSKVLLKVPYSHLNLILSFFS